MEKFEDISMRGRIAYIICLFERLLLYYQCNIDEWKTTLEFLWSFTEAEFVDEWWYELVEYLPDYIYEDTTDDLDYLTEKEVCYLRQLYQKTEQDILSFFNIMYDIINGNLYWPKCDPIYKLDQIEAAINILKKHNIEIVDVEPFKKYSFEKCDGWGEDFDGKKEFSILL